MRKKIIKTTIEEIVEENVICIDVPLIIKLLEWAREEAVSDEALHIVAAAMHNASIGGDCLTMAHYNGLTPKLEDIVLE